jgi:hypothetical protein
MSESAQAALEQLGQDLGVVIIPRRAGMGSAAARGSESIKFQIAAGSFLAIYCGNSMLKIHYNVV